MRYGRYYTYSAVNYILKWNYFIVLLRIESSSFEIVFCVVEFTFLRFSIRSLQWIMNTDKDDFTFYKFLVKGIN